MTDRYDSDGEGLIPAAAGRAWAAVDRQIVDQAPAISLLVPRASS